MLPVVVPAGEEDAPVEGKECRVAAVGLDLPFAYLGVMIAGCLAVCALALALEREISPTANGASPSKVG